ncbi:Zn-dependent protease with chaperone function [Rheinheimera pacifica]|uniref:M48 family metallopeptidase n=1 Tax=Rheinheimera pacifica TaxID=173990 RepID=UPI00286221B7|nr:M48 family metallopeptidase [Rheinheimera pacifica]MDR6983439.1 Zn-dependent protease with chaperone function [Rheinheimera pacifica]
MDSIYPANPTNIPPDLTKPSKAHKRHVWLAVLGLITFVLVYLLLTVWFGWSSYSLIYTSITTGQGNLFTWLVALSAGFLTLFMVKALLFVKKGSIEQEYEVTAQSEPQLFRFLFRLADETGAPRPHRVFLSPRVNACVFYDLSLLNFFFPSKKNLEIGLPLVNALTVSELKAVLAHEFGHFAQRSMALGNWVYIAQQIAAHIIAKRDALDNFLRFLSNVDLRVAWFGWILRLIVWSLRATMETIFNLVLLAQRALSREMEFQADLVAVSVTGSDALIHALHKLQAADEAWDRAQSFVNDQVREGKASKDLFAVQLRVIKHMSGILNDPDYGCVAQVPASNPEQHRVFTADIAQPPRMWATHPYNHEREQNAKKIYVPGVLDDRSSWIIFDDAQALKEKFTSTLLSRFDVEYKPDEEIFSLLDKVYAREYLNSRYRGAYLGRSFVRHAAKPDVLYESNIDSAISTLSELYPEDLSGKLEQLRTLERERDLLIALRDGFYTPPDGVIRFRGNEIKKRELAKVIEEVSIECAGVQEVIFNHDKRCRTAHKRAAEQLGQGWDEYLAGLLALLHYADHMQANIADSRALLNNVYAVVTADRNVSSRELKRLVAAGTDVFRALAIVYRDAAQVQLDTGIQQRLEIENWANALGDFTFVAPDKHNISDWLNASDSWLNATLDWLGALRQVALEQLLVSEAQVAGWAKAGTTAMAAPARSQVPHSYPTLTPGEERALQKRLDLWDRFQTADGFVAGAIRFVVAASIIGGALYLTAAQHLLL